MVDYSARACLERAQQQLALNTDLADSYACLELRQCIEAISYKKLKAYKVRAPEELFSKWQPAQVIGMLTELEPLSDVDCRISIFEEVSQGNPCRPVLTFDQKEISAKFINKRYHKLGHHLHAPTISDRSKTDDPSRFHRYLLKLADELAEYVNATAYCTIAQTISIDCQECSQKIVRNVRSLKVGNTVICFNLQCLAQYVIEDIKDNSFTYRLSQTMIQCECEEEIWIPVHLIKENSHVVCHKCGSKFLFSKRWQYTKIA